MRILRLLFMVIVLVGVGYLGLQAFDVYRFMKGDGSSAQAGEATLAQVSANEEQPAPIFAPQPATGNLGVTARGDNLGEINKRAIDLLEKGELEEAVELFDKCVEGDPKEDVFARNLAEALARLARVEQEQNDAERRARSLELLRRAMQLDPSRKDLAKTLGRWERSAAAEEEFWHKQTAHFELSFDGTREELMSGTTSLEIELEAAYLDFGELFGFFPVEDGAPRIRVVLYRRADFDKVTGIGSWAGGIFDGVVRVPVQDLMRELEWLKRVLRHELIHAFVRVAGGPHVPGWLNEGLAQWFEAPFEGDRAHAIKAARAALRGTQLFSLERLTGSLVGWKDTDEIRRAYAQSLAFISHLRRMYGERLLFEMVEGCLKGISPEDTFKARLGFDISDAIADLAQEVG